MPAEESTVVEPAEPPSTTGAFRACSDVVQATRATANSVRNRADTENRRKKGYGELSERHLRTFRARRKHPECYIPPRMRRLFLPPAVALVLAAQGCRDTQRSEAPAPPPPGAEFVLSAGDSAFWITSDSAGIRSRGAPIELARLDERFVELYIVDDDLSYPGADLVGQSVYRRDLRTGDSVLVFRDSIVPALAREYARDNPGERPLRADEEPDDDPALLATATIELGAAHGPFVSYSLHTDVERGTSPLWHVSRRGVFDLRSGKAASIADITGNAATARTVLDSARRDPRLDVASFAITTVDGRPAIAWAIPGAGHGDDAQLAPLDPIPFDEPAWWTDNASALPVTSADGTRDVWRHRRYSVVVRYDSVGDATLSLRDSTSREWKVGAVSAPAMRIYWLDTPTFDGDARTALARAFHEASTYGAEPGRVAMAHSRTLHLARAPGWLRARMAHPR